MQKPTTYTATVSSVTNVAGNFYVAKLTLAGPKEMLFQAGQYIIFQIGPPKLRHTLSITSSPADNKTIDILQSVAPMGEGSQWMLGLKPGDTVQFLGPLGKFILQKKSLRPKVFIATGCGIAPLRSMILDYVETGGTAAVTLWWGLRHETDVFWQKEFEDITARYTNFHAIITLSQPGVPWTGQKGRVTVHVVEETPELAQSEFYLCGTREMIVDMRELLVYNGIPQGQIFTEAFF